MPVQGLAELIASGHFCRLLPGGGEGRIVPGDRCNDKATVPSTGGW
jgi:hypothetical protein